MNDESELWISIVLANLKLCLLCRVAYHHLAFHPTITEAMHDYRNSRNKDLEHPVAD